MDIRKYSSIMITKHIEEADEKQHPVLHRWKTNPWHELFSREVDEQLREEIMFYKEEWEFLKRDILQEIDCDKVVIEGCALLPSLVSDLFQESDCFYMVPTQGLSFILSDNFREKHRYKKEQDLKLKILFFLLF
ncbi:MULTISPECIES: hypothetical protein [unclassified Fusibacter]|uniref:hypothetical protein n=1 Tax=unclassified Fusibacter TaxID=2624464 RepID=UPI0010134F9D|nr:MULTISPECIES: hypothetical protein [unclassified Fusibacter]MCK8060913.1 hypothetical protein [Fusibacter sp. A2]NPE23209.1 hypothetical protein [Fusibacter sp. A1]RXV59565.1 hypothetical protein DWB64_15365 [Fusibacter sp. A1]